MRVPLPAIEPADAFDWLLAITHDPLRLRWGKKDVYADLGAERFVGAQKGKIRIAVEIKSFTGPSPIDALE